MDRDTEAAHERGRRVASVLMTKALEDGAETTAEAYGAKAEHLRGETTCAGKRCGVAVVYQRAHRRAHRDGYVEMFAGFRLAKEAEHTPTCDIDLQIGAKRRGVLVAASKTGAAAAILTMAMDPHGKGRALDQRLLRIRWDAVDAPPRITVATPSATFATTGGPRAGGRPGAGGARRAKRITSAADVERERLAILRDADPKAAAERLAIFLGDDPTAITWGAFFHNWDLNGSSTIARIVEEIEQGGAANGVAFAARAVARPTRRSGAWDVRCRTVVGVGARTFSLRIVLADRAVADSVRIGKSYVFAGPEVWFERSVVRGVTHETVSVGVLSKRWIAESEEARPEQIERLRRRSA
jgi:hypothetical protein